MESFYLKFGGRYKWKLCILSRSLGHRCIVIQNGSIGCQSVANVVRRFVLNVFGINKGFVAVVGLLLLLFVPTDNASCALSNRG